MRNFVTVLVLLSSLAFTFAANARPCPAGAKAEILEGLEGLSNNLAASEIEREEALFAISLIENSNKLSCAYQSGVAGNIYALQTETHRMIINFGNGQITDLTLRRIRTN